MSADAPRAVTLVGAGPGDVDLLTLDAERAVAAARELVVDRDLAPLVAALGVRAPVTWAHDDEPATEALLAAVDRGPGVVRLYLGDPWVHPAGDDERGALLGAGVAPEVVPGLVAEVAAAGAAGIPVQERTLAVTTTFAADRPGAPSALSTSTIAVPADPTHTLVVRTTDLARTAAALAADTPPGAALAVPAAAVPTGGAAPGPCPAVRAPLGELAAVAPAGAGVVVVGLVAALDLTAAAGGTAPDGTAPDGVGPVAPLDAAPSGSRT